MVNFLGLDDVKAFLKVTGSNSDADARLTVCAEAACDWVEGQCGPVVEQQLVETVTPIAGYARLAHAPTSIVAIESLNGALIASTAPIVSSAILIESATPVRVTYRAGDTVPPSWARMAALNFASALFSRQLRQQGPGATGPTSYASQQLAEQLIEAHKLGPRP